MQKRKNVFILSDDEVVDTMINWIKDADADDLVYIAEQMFGGYCQIDTSNDDIQYHFRPNEDYEGSFGVNDEYNVYDLATVLSVTTGILFTNFKEVIDLMQYMTGELFPDYAAAMFEDQCREALFKQFPHLKRVNDYDEIKGNRPLDCDNFLRNCLCSSLGNTFKVIPINKKGF